MQLVCMMATPTVNSPRSLANSNNSDGQQALTVNAWVTFYTKTQANGKGKKVRTGTTKETITKEFMHLFVNDEVNYSSFLQMILDKHHLSKYKVAQQAVFPCKVRFCQRSESTSGCALRLLSLFYATNLVNPMQLISSILMNTMAWLPRSTRGCLPGLSLSLLRCLRLRRYF